MTWLPDLEVIHWLTCMRPISERNVVMPHCSFLFLRGKRQADRSGRGRGEADSRISRHSATMVDGCRRAGRQTHPLLDHLSHRKIFN